ncbi:MAG: hypothetical protein PVI26_02415 [Chitinispirillia bacterium]|jgi:hypothetical protein
MRIDEVISDYLIEIEGRQKLICVKAFELAKKYSISIKEIGEYCNKNKIKISDCQLGCFK